MRSEEKSNEQRLNSQINEATRLICKCQQSPLCKIRGIDKLANKIRAERQFLSKIENFSSNISKHLDASNLPFFCNLIAVAERETHCISILKTFTSFNAENRRKLGVDLVVENGAKWMKIISRSSRSLFLEVMGANSSRSLCEQAKDYCAMARQHLHLFRMPIVQFEFTSAIPQRLAARLRKKGVEVVGEEVCMSECGISSSDSTTDEESAEVVESDEESAKVVESTVVSSANAINLDITAVFVLVSALTQPNGCNYEFKQQLLNNQAEMERINPALEFVNKCIQGRRLILCRSAFESVQEIIKTVAGVSERKRTEQLLQRVQIVEDQLTQRAKELKLSDKISKRATIIFGSGDYYQAITLTANKHFVQASEQQGVRFAVILHESRALSEQKREEATPIGKLNCD